MKRFLAALTVALLFGLVVITVLGGVAFGTIVGSLFQAENMPKGTTQPPTGVFNPGIGKGSASECTKTISSGSIESAANNLNAGGVLCLREGTYQEADGRINIRTSGTASAPKKIKAYPSERVEIRSGFRANVPGSNWVIEGVFVDSSYSPVETTQSGRGPRTNTAQALSWGAGSNILVDSVELINRRTGDKSGTCVFGGRSVDLTIQNSWIHRCGQLPRDNQEHCIYAGNAQGITIRNNLIADCANRSVQLYNNTVRNNVVDTSNGDPLSTGGVYTGAGDVVRDNCVWDVAPELAAKVVSGSNIVVNPQIANRKVTNATCAAKLPLGSPFRP